MDPWPHQITGHAETTAALEAGERRICVTLTARPGLWYGGGDLKAELMQKHDKTLDSWSSGYQPAGFCPPKSRPGIKGFSVF